MARNYYRRMSKNKIISLILGIFIILGTFGASAMLFTSDKKDVPFTAFSVGGLDSQGEYVEAENTLITEKLIECQGLEIKPGLKTTSSYQVYLYDANKEFLEVTNTMHGEYKLTRTDVRYCRIMIIPDEFGDEDFEIKFFDIWNYVNDYSIKVNRKQNFEIKNYFEKDKSGKIASYDASTKELQYVSEEGYGASKIADIVGVKTLKVEFESAQPEKVSLLFFTRSENGGEVVYTYVSAIDTNTASTVQTINVPTNATHMIVNYELTERLAIYSAD